MAAAAKIDASHLSRIERGHERPTEPVRARIAAVLGLDPSEVTRQP